MPARLIIDAGLRFGSCTVVHETAQIQRTNRKVRAFKCKCDCGKIFVANIQGLRTGDIKSCGCRHRPHGQTRTLTHHVWKAMRQRCKNPNNKDYHNYGGLGVSVCARWDDYTKFLADMGPTPEGMSLDRINPEGDYEPTNCRWATASVQANNKRNTRRFDVNGATGSVAELARRFGRNPKLIHQRLKLGWSIESALRIPVTSNETRRAYLGGTNERP